MSYVKSKRGRYQGVGAIAAAEAAPRISSVLSASAASRLSAAVAVSPSVAIRTDVPGEPCCSLLPDQDAVRGCISPPLPPGTCGVIVCKNPDGTWTKIDICGPLPAQPKVRTPPTLKLSTVRPALTSKISAAQQPATNVDPFTGQPLSPAPSSSASSLRSSAGNKLTSSAADLRIGTGVGTAPPKPTKPLTPSQPSETDVDRIIQENITVNTSVMPSPATKAPVLTPAVVQVSPPAPDYTDPGIVYVAPAPPASSSALPWLIGGGILAWLLLKD